METKELKWFSNLLNVNYQSVKNAIKYLNIQPIVSDKYDIKIVPTLQQFFKDNSDLRVLFIKQKYRENFNTVKKQVNLDGGWIIADIVNEHDIEYWRLITLLHDNNIKIKHIKKIGYITLNEYEFIKPLLNSIKLNGAKIRSLPENEISSYISEIYKGEIVKNYRRGLGNGQEIDIYLPKLNIGIEFNGTYWHSSLTGTDRNYHKMKSINAEKNNIWLIHIYEHEWNNVNYQNKLKLFLKNITSSKIDRLDNLEYDIKLIDNLEAEKFNDKYGLSNFIKSKINYGLYLNNELMQILSFNPTSKNNWKIVNNINKIENYNYTKNILNKFINKYNPDRITVSCDFNKFNGNEYLNAGMTFIKYSELDKYWILADGSVINVNTHKYKEMKDKSIAELFGSGNKIFEWKKEI